MALQAFNISDQGGISSKEGVGIGTGAVRVIVRHVVMVTARESMRRGLGPRGGWCKVELVSVNLRLESWSDEGMRRKMRASRGIDMVGYLSRVLGRGGWVGR